MKRNVWELQYGSKLKQNDRKGLFLYKTKYMHKPSGKLKTVYEVTSDTHPNQSGFFNTRKMAEKRYSKITNMKR